MGDLPSCWSESFQDKRQRFANDVSTIGDELRLLLREISRLYYEHEYTMEDGAMDLEYRGFCQWYEPFDATPDAVRDNVADWAKRFQRAARLVDVSGIVDEISSPIDLNLVGDVSQCLTDGWTPRIGHVLLRAVQNLRDQVAAFTEAVDIHQFNSADGTPSAVDVGATIVTGPPNAEPVGSQPPEDPDNSGSNPKMRELRLQLAARFLRNPPEIFEYFDGVVNDALNLLEWRDLPGTDVTCTFLSEGATQEKIRDWFERLNGFGSGTRLAVSRASEGLREYLVHRFVMADAATWTIDGKKIPDDRELADDVVWAMIESWGIVPKRVWYGLHNMRAAMFRGLGQEPGSAIWVGDDPDLLGDSYSDVVVFLSSLRDRLFLDDELNTELTELASGRNGELSSDAQKSAAATKVIEAESMPDGPDESTVEVVAPVSIGRVKAASVNVLMIELMQKHGQDECLGWSVRRWALELAPRRGKKPSESTIHGTPTYQLLKGLNDQKKAAMVERQTAKDKTGKRRSTRF